MISEDERKEYKSPKLHVYGDIKKLTQNAAKVGPGDGGYTQSAPG